MALSVLVALMMLAVPLASSSNLFVDGGQTNSNGDAPVLGDNLSPRVDFILNESTTGRISLDSVKTDDLVTALNNSSGGYTSDTKYGGKVAWYVGENGNIFAILENTDTKYVSMQYLIYALTAVVDGSSNPLVSKVGYTVDSWKSDSAVYSPISTEPAAGDRITKDTTVTAKWNLDGEKYAEIPVDVIVDGELFKEYVKVYPKFKGAYNEGATAIDEKNVYISAADTFIADGVSDVNIWGIVVNADLTGGKFGPNATKLYDFKTTYGDNKEIANDAAELKIPLNSKLTTTYSFDSKTYSKITVSSSAFTDGKDVILFADNNRTYTYKNVYEALQYPDTKVTENHGLSPAIVISGEDKNKNPITDNGYRITGWNGGAALIGSELTATSPLTLDAELNGYYVLFMSKGQFEYVYVPFGELSADLVKTLDINGVNHWAWMEYDDGPSNSASYVDTITSSSFKTFGSFTDSLIDEVEKLVTSGYDGKKPIAVFIACFESTNNTAYAVFDGDGANFGNEYVTKLIIPGKIATKIVKPTIAPVYDQDESRTLFMGWNKEKSSSGAKSPVDSSGESKEDMYVKGEVTTYEANPQSYDYKITFYDGSEVVGVFYYKEGTPSSTAGIDNGLVAIEYDGLVYAKADVDTSVSPQNAATKAYLSVLEYSKAGYAIKQWNDVDGKSMYIVATAKVNISDMKDDLDLYAQFDAKSYTIKYVNTFEGTQNQIAYVDQSTTLYGTGTFIHEGYDLKAWSTVPGNSGDKYDLGATFVLNGADFEKLAESAGDDGVVIELYSVWEYNGGSGSGTGGNTGGDNDNTALYLIAGMLAVIAILAIVGILLMRRK